MRVSHSPADVSAVFDELNPCRICRGTGFVYRQTVKCGYCGRHPKDGPSVAGRRAKMLAEATASGLTARFAPGTTDHHPH
jgi:hypothetical protein